MLSEEVQETIVEFLNKGVEEGHFEIEENDVQEEYEDSSQNHISPEKNKIFRVEEE